MSGMLKDKSLSSSGALLLDPLLGRLPFTVVWCMVYGVHFLQVCVCMDCKHESFIPSFIKIMRFSHKHLTICVSHEVVMIKTQ